MGRLRDGYVIVEGKHDARALEKLGIHSLYWNSIPKTGLANGKTFYIMTDRDKGGEEKREKAISALLGMDSASDIDTDTGAFFMKLLGITSVEQAIRPAEEILGDDYSCLKSDIHGKDLSRHSKVHDRG